MASIGFLTASIGFLSAFTVILMASTTLSQPLYIILRPLQALPSTQDTPVSSEKAGSTYCSYEGSAFAAICFLGGNLLLLGQLG
jgi:hypothetical protein